MHEPIEITYFHDILCAWCFVAGERVRALKSEYGDAVKVTLRPFPVRSDEERPTRKEQLELARNSRKASREPEGRLITSALWKGDDLPLSSMPPLYAVEAAAVQGNEAREALIDRLRVGAHVQGLNVSRTDVLFELAARTGLDMSRFQQAFESKSSRKGVDASCEDAGRHGVRAVPALAIGEEWLITGLRPMVEYRQIIRRYREERLGGVPERRLH